MEERKVTEIRLSELAEKAVKGIAELIKERQIRKIKTSDELVEYIDKVLKRALPEDFKEFSARWEDPNKVVLEFRKKLKEKVVKVFE